MTNLDTLYALIVAAAPAITAIIGIIAAVIKNHKDIQAKTQPILDKFDELRQEVNDKTELTEVKIQMEAIMVENRQLKQEIADLITVLKKVKYEIPKE